MTAPVPGAQTERRGEAGPVRALLGGETSPAAWLTERLLLFGLLGFLLGLALLAPLARLFLLPPAVVEQHEPVQGGGERRLARRFHRFSWPRRQPLEGPQEQRLGVGVLLLS